LPERIRRFRRRAAALKSMFIKSRMKSVKLHGCKSCRTLPVLLIVNDMVKIQTGGFAVLSYQYESRCELP
jgi:hypothetical protein